MGYIVLSHVPSTLQRFGLCYLHGGSIGSTTTMAVKVVAQPTASAAAVTDGSAPLTSICASGTNGSLNVALPTFNVTKTFDAAISTPNVRIKADLVFTDLTTGLPTTLFTNIILNVDAVTGDVNAADMAAAVLAAKGGVGGSDFDSWGTYKLTVNSISDKISRKDLNAAGGYFAVAGVSATYSVLKTPTTGPIYHVVNANSL